MKRQNFTHYVFRSVGFNCLLSLLNVNGFSIPIANAAVPGQCSSASLSENQSKWIEFIDQNYGKTGATGANKILDLWNYRVTDTSSSNYGKPLLSKCTLARELSSGGMCEYYFRSSQSGAIDAGGYPGIPKAPAACGMGRLGSAGEMSTGCVNAKGSLVSETWDGLNASGLTDRLGEGGVSIELALKNILMSAIASPENLCGILGPPPATGKITGTDIKGMVQSAGSYPQFYKGRGAREKTLYVFVGLFYHAQLTSGGSVGNVIPTIKPLYCPSSNLGGGSGSVGNNHAAIVEIYAKSLARGKSGGVESGNTMLTIPEDKESFSDLSCGPMLSGGLYSNLTSAMQTYSSFVYFNENFANSQLLSPRVLVYQSQTAPLAPVLLGYKVKSSVCTAAGKTSSCYVTVDGFKAAIAPHSISESGNLPLLLSMNGNVLNDLSSLSGTPFSSGILENYSTGTGSTTFEMSSGGFPTQTQIQQQQVKSQGTTQGS